MQEATVVAEIALEMTDLMCDNSDSDKINNRCRMLLHLAQIHQQNSSNPAFNADEELNLAEHYYLSDRGRKEDMLLCKDLSYAYFLCERKRFAEAIAVLEDMRNLDQLLWNKYVYVEYFSCAFYGAGVEKSVKMDGELFTTVGDILYNLLVRAYVGMGKKKEAVAACETLTDVNLLDVHESKFGRRPSCKPHLIEDCHRQLLSLLSEEDRHQFLNCDFPLSSANLAKLHHMLGEILEMKIFCLRSAGNQLVNSNRGNESLSLFQNVFEMLQVKEGFLDKPLHDQWEILQTYSCANQYYLFLSLGGTHAERENIDAAIQCYEKCIELDEDFVCGQDVVALLSDLYQIKAFTVNLDNGVSSLDYMIRALMVFQELFRKTALTAFVEFKFASLLSRLDCHEEAFQHFWKVAFEKANHTLPITLGNVEKSLVDAYLRREIEVRGGKVSMPIIVLVGYEIISTYTKRSEFIREHFAQDYLSFLEKYVEDSEDSLVRSMAGYAYMIAGNKEKAAEIFVSVLEMNPGHPPVTEALESCGDLKKCDQDDGECLDIIRLQDFPWRVDQREFAPDIRGNEGCGMVVNKSSKENHEKNFGKFRITEYEVPKSGQNEMDASRKIQYYSFLSLGKADAEIEDIDTAIQCYERCIELDEDFTCDQDIVATLSELYQTKALTVDMENEDSRKLYMDLAWELFQKLFQKTAELTTFIELSYASLLKRLGRYEEAVGHFYKVIERTDDKSLVKCGNMDKPLLDVYLCREIEALGGSVDIPEKVMSAYELISTFMKLNRKGKAQKVASFLESVVQNYPLEIDDDLITHSMAGYAYKIIGNKEKAAEIFISVLEKNPAHPPVTEALESLCM